jgi:hypothetical protein
MNRFFSSIARLIASPASANASTVAQPDSVAQALMERAEAGAGRDPHHAEELRMAASAYLSVVR